MRTIPARPAAISASVSSGATPVDRRQLAFVSAQVSMTWRLKSVRCAGLWLRSHQFNLAKSGVAWNDSSELQRCTGNPSSPAASLRCFPTCSGPGLPTITSPARGEHTAFSGCSRMTPRLNGGFICLGNSLSGFIDRVGRDSLAAGVANVDPATQPAGSGQCRGERLNGICLKRFSGGSG